MPQTTPILDVPCGIAPVFASVVARDGLDGSAYDRLAADLALDSV